jgi:hypothetical protein
MEEDYDDEDDDEYQGIMPEVRLEEYSDPSEPEDDDRSQHTRYKYLTYLKTFFQQLFI